MFPVSLSAIDSFAFAITSSFASFLPIAKCSFRLSIDLYCDLNRIFNCLSLVKFRPVLSGIHNLFRRNLQSARAPLVICGATGFDRVIKSVSYSPFVISIFLIELIDQSHHRCDCGIVFQVLIIAADLFDRLVHLGLKLFGISCFICHDIL